MPKPVQPGDVFARLTVVQRATRQGYLLCSCSCGNQKDVRSDHLRRGLVQSCGCLHRERASARASNMHKANVTHNKSNSAAYASWLAMKQRCTNPNSKFYSYYGGRGITICSSWLNSFENFYADMGDPPSGHTIDRIDNEKGYDPTNCRWAPRIVQLNNRRTNRRVTFLGVTATVTQWARLLGFPRNTLDQRLAAGWSVERAFTEPATRQKDLITHCKRGHEFKPGSYYVTKIGTRACKACYEARKRRD